MTEQVEQKSEDKELRFKKRVFELENKVASLERKLIDLNASIEERALSIVEMLCGTMAQQIRMGREHNKQPIPNYKFLKVDEENPANELTFTLILTENGPTIMGQTKEGGLQVVKEGPLHALAQQFLIQNNAEFGVAMQANLLKLTPEAPAAADNV